MGPIVAVFANAWHALRSLRWSGKVSVDVRIEHPFGLPPPALLCRGLIPHSGRAQGKRDHVGRRARAEDEGGEGVEARGLSQVWRLGPEQS